MGIFRILVIFIVCIPFAASAAQYDYSGLKLKYFRYLFPPVNTMVPSPAKYKFVGEWIRRKGPTSTDYHIKVKTYVYKNDNHHLVYIKFKRHGMPFCWWYSKLTEGKPPRGWTEGACDVNNDGIYEEVWDINGYDTLNWNFCRYWNCESY